MRKVTLAELDQEIEVTERDLAELRQQRAALALTERPTGAVMEYLRRHPGECAKGEIQAGTGLHITVLSMALAKLTEAGELRRVRWGVYVVTQQTRADQSCGPA